MFCAELDCLVLIFLCCVNSSRLVAGGGAEQQLRHERRVFKEETALTEVVPTQGSTQGQASAT